MGQYMAIGGALVSALGSVEQSRREEEAYNYETKKAENEMFVTRQATEMEVADTEGSPLQVMADSAAQNELDAKRREYAGTIQLLGYQDIAYLNRFQAKQTERELFNRAGATALSSYANSGAGSSLMSSGSSGFSMSSSGGGK